MADDFARVRKAVRRMIPDANKAAHDAGALAVELIDKRVTQEGKDRYGRKLKPYAKQTKELRKARGRQTAHVDLVDSGNMMAALTYRARGNKAEVMFGKPAEAEKAWAHQTGKGRLPKREFFGLTKDERRKVAAKVKEHIGRG